jgi:hypothetical protein
MEYLQESHNAESALLDKIYHISQVQEYWS